MILTEAPVRSMISLDTSKQPGSIKGEAILHGGLQTLDYALSSPYLAQSSSPWMVMCCEACIWFKPLKDFPYIIIR